MKYFEVIKENCTWVNLLLVGYWTSVVSFVFYLVQIFLVFGLSNPTLEYEYNLFSSLVYAFVFRSLVNESVAKEKQDSFEAETVYYIEKMRDEIEQLKEKIGE